MKRMMAGLALLAGISVMTAENGAAQMTTSGTGLTSGTSVHQTLDQSQSSLNNSKMGVFISTTGSTSGSLSSLSIERFETRHRRLYAIVSLGELVDVSGLTPGMIVSGTSTQFRSPRSVVYMDGRYSAIYNDKVVSLRRSGDGNMVDFSSRGVGDEGENLIDLDEGGIADNDGNIIDFGSPGVARKGEPLISLDEGGIADNDGNIIDFGSRGVGDEGENLIELDEGGIADNDGNIIDFGSRGTGSKGEPLVDIDREDAALIDLDEGGVADNDGNIVDFGAPGVNTRVYTWDTESGIVYELSEGTLSMYDTLSFYGSDMLVAVPVSVSGASCEEIQLNLDVSGLSGRTIRRDGSHGAMTDRTLELKSDLIPVTISTSQLSSSSTPVTMVSDETSSAMCMVSSLVNGQASRHAIVDHLNMVIGSSTTSEMTAMR